MKFINKMERKFGRFAIRRLSMWLIIAYAIGYVMLFLNPRLLTWTYLEPYAIFQGGQIWRLFTWILTPPTANNIFFVVIMMMFYYSIGNSLENTWGAFRYNLYIFSGMLFTVLGACILYFVTGMPVNIGGLFSTYYINLSIFLAFAACYPNMQVLLYFVIPIKIKWLAYLDVALLAYTFIKSDSWVERISIIISLLNFIIFFFATRNYKYISPKEVHRRQTYKRKTSTTAQTAFRGSSITKHKCAICGKTEKDDDALEFRFCSKCNGNYEYCQNHLFTHTHVQ